MRVLVRKFLRGLLGCVVAVAVTSCVGMSGDESRWPTVDDTGGAATAPLSGVNAIRVRVAENALENRDYDTAIRFYTSIQEAEPGHFEPLMGLGEAYLAKRDFDAAEVAFRKAIGAYPRRAETYEGLGRTLVAKDDFKGAIEAFNRALARAPSAALHNKLGVAHDLMGDGEGAQKHYRTALLLDTGHTSARNNLALSLAISEQFDEAIGEMERVALVPGATQRHRQNLAFVYGMAGQFDSAARVLGKEPYEGREREENETLFDRIRTLAKAGDRRAVLGFLSSSNGAGYDQEEPGATRVAARSSDTPAGQQTARLPHERSLKAKEAGSPSAEEAKPEPEPADRKVARLSPPEEAMPVTVPKAEAAPPTGSEGPSEDSVAGQIWRLQLASYRSESRAFRGKKLLETLLGDKASGVEVLVRRDHTPDSRRIDFRLRTMAVKSRTAGQQACEEIRAAGHPECLVILHNASLWRASVPAVAEETAVAADGDRLFRIQLASYRTKTGALRGRDVLVRILGAQVVEQFDVMVRRDLVQDHRAFDYRIRSKPLMTRDEATRICEAIQRAGHTGCLIIRHNERLWETATATTAERAEAETEAENGGIAYRVQLASYRKSVGAAKAKERLEGLVAGWDANIGLSLRKVSLSSSNGTFYRIRTSPLENREDAARLCTHLKQAGHTGCLILKV